MYVGESSVSQPFGYLVTVVFHSLQKDKNILESQLQDILGNYPAFKEQITHSHRLGEIFKSIPGSGKIMSAKLLALMGDNKSAYNNAAEVQAYSGIAPIIKRSGKKSRTVFRFSCNKDFRDILTLFSYCAMQWCPWARAFYDRKRKEGKRHFQACRLLAFTWLRIIYVLWEREELYDESIHSANVARYYQRNIKST